VSPDPPLDPILAGKSGTRVTWSRVPAAVRASIEDHLGSYRYGAAAERGRPRP
jgi:hypothetical protein